ncbi:MAG: hypothetical protein KAS12_03120 [Candidatus Aenigmarchaeota archaeon]|nr:hypothetical protein [Candidatus Aenigmarchaeota archaeon]
MRLKHIKAQTAIPAAIISLIVLLLVFYVMFATGNRFTEHLMDVKDKMGWFGDVLDSVSKISQSVG